VLLAAALAPTDPVLAGDVQVGPPLEKSKSDVKFTLTAEAGLNDGISFPFTWLAITIALRATNDASLFEWFYFDLLYRIAAGLIIGYVVGKIIAYLVFTLPKKRDVVASRDGFIAISSTLLVYGVTEMVSGYGFVAVFICAVTLRNYELDHEFHVELHSFTDQIERMLMAIVLLLFGGTLVLHVFPDIVWQALMFAAVLVFVVRPLTSIPSVLGADLHNKEKGAISFYGIRGIGSLFYLSFGLQHTVFERAGELWDLACVVIFLSIVVHGFSASAVMERIGAQFPQTRKKAP
jgi:NhaP-type Na+/H+ or K+/H+ antiporter